MRTFSLFSYFASSFAIFSMFFGAGNVIFPLVLGSDWSDQLLFALLGLGLTGIVLPTLGLISMALYDGQYESYFSRIGPQIGFIVLCVIMLLIGPFGAMPRIITVSYSTWAQSIPNTPFWAFNLGFCVLMLLVTYRLTSLLRVLGYILTPLLLFFLILIIVIGLANGVSLPAGTNTFSQDLLIMAHGAQMGYNTMDLLGALAFGAVVVTALKSEFAAHGGNIGQHDIIRHVTISSIIAGVLLALVYAGLSVLSAMYASELQHANSEELISVLTLHILGEHAGLVANGIVLLACLTTGIALAAAFADFLNQKLNRFGNHYHKFLILTVGVSFIVAFLGFSKIMVLLMPILFVCYPVIIVLALCNIAYKLWGFQYIKIPAAIAFTAALVTYYFVL